MIYLQKVYPQQLLHFLQGDFKLSMCQSVNMTSARFWAYINFFYFLRVLPPRPNSVPNNTTSSLLMQQSQLLVQNPSRPPISKEDNKNDEFRLPSGNARTGNCVDIKDSIMGMTYYVSA